MVEAGVVALVLAFQSVVAQFVVNGTMFLFSFQALPGARSLPATRFRGRLRMRSWCLIRRLSTTTALAPPGPSSVATMVIKCAISTSKSLITEETYARFTLATRPPGFEGENQQFAMQGRFPDEAFGQGEASGPRRGSALNTRGLPMLIFPKSGCAGFKI